nr:retrovirus-related Pol polyprotein from transposon TNT 1-94 [Tanacetum cinerariifolium]
THLGLWYPKGTGIEIAVYDDSDHVGDYVDRKSTSGKGVDKNLMGWEKWVESYWVEEMVVREEDYDFIFKALLIRKISRQSNTAMSSTEAKYIAASKATREAILIRKLIFGLGVIPSNDRPMDMYSHNTGTITIADEPGVQKGAKHF